MCATHRGNGVDNEPEVTNVRKWYLKTIPATDTNDGLQSGSKQMGHSTPKLRALARRRLQKLAMLAVSSLALLWCCSKLLLPLVLHGSFQRTPSPSAQHHAVQGKHPHDRVEGRRDLRGTPKKLRYRTIQRCAKWREGSTDKESHTHTHTHTKKNAECVLCLRCP